MGSYDIAGIAKKTTALRDLLKTKFEKIGLLISRSFKVWTESRKDIELVFSDFTISRRSSSLPIFLEEADGDPSPEAFVTDTIGSLRRDVFERRESTGSEFFSLLICLDASKFGQICIA